jgi:hypothetical protein
MYALAYHWTRTFPAALVAGAAYLFVPARLQYVAWPGIVGNQWTPLVLLFAHRLAQSGRWRDALGLAAFVAMQILESVYQMVPLAVYGAVYAPVLLLRHRAQWRELWPKLALVAAIAGAAVAAIVVPVLEARRVWGTMAGHMSMLPFLHGLARGKSWYLGTTVLVLAAVGLGDRLRRRDSDDPRLPLLAGCLLLISLCTAGVVVPGTGVVPSLGALLSDYVPGLDVVRGLQFALLGLWVAPALLAAYGVRALTRRLPAALAVAVGFACAALVAAEPSSPALSIGSYGATFESAAAPFTLPGDVVAMLRESVPDGAVLDLPAADAPLAFPRKGHYLLTAAFHEHPTNACCASFPSPLALDVDVLTNRLPDPRAVDALVALGFRSAVLHREEYASVNDGDVAATRYGGTPVGRSRLVEVGNVRNHTLYRLESGAAVATGIERLAPAGRRGLSERPQTIHPGVAKITLWYANAGPGTYLHPQPYAPTVLGIRWLDGGDATVREDLVSAIVPLAIGAGDLTGREFEVPSPAAPGVYRVMAAPADAPDMVIASATVVVLAPGPARP